MRPRWTSRPASVTRSALRLGGRAACALAAIACLASGCQGELYDLPPRPGVDAGASLDEGPMGDGDVGDLVTGPAYFTPQIQGDLDRLGCGMAGACHGGTTAPMRLVPNAKDDASLHFNFDQVRPRALADDKSIFLQKALQSSGVAHAGPQPFANASDATYRSWLAWVRAGAPFSASGGTP